MKRIKHNLSRHGKIIKEHGNRIKHHSTRLKNHVIKHATSSPPHPYFVYSIIILIVAGTFFIGNSGFNFNITGHVTDFGGISTEENTSNPSDLSEWPMFRRSLNHTAYVASNVNTTKINLSWTFAVSGGLASSPSVSNGILYIGSNSANVTYAVNTTNGAQLWNVSTGNITGASVAIADGKIFTTSGFFNNNQLYAINATNGSVIWNFSYSPPIRGSPLVVNNTLYVGTIGFQFYAINATSGAQIWQAFPGPDGINFESSPAYFNNTIYVGSNSNKTYALNATSGSVLWSYTNSSFFQSSPAVANGMVYIGNDNNQTYAINASGNNSIWNFTTGGSVRSSPAVANDVVYIGSDDNQLYALNATTGTKIWNYTTGNDIRSSPLVTNTFVAFGSDDNQIYILNISTGARIWNYTGENWMRGGPIVVNNKLYTGDINGKVYQFNLSGNTLPTFSTVNFSVPVSDSSFTINWAASDADNDALFISCYGDEANTSYAKSFACFENAANTGSKSCDTSSWPSGQLFNIWCSANDGYATANSYATSSGKISIQHNSSWPMFHADLAHTAYSTANLGTTTITNVWNFSTGGRVASSPAVANGIVYFGSWDNNRTYAVNASSGALIWNVTGTGTNTFISSPAIVSNIVYIGSADKHLYAFNASTGAKIWNFTTNGNIDMSSPAIANNIVYIGDVGNKFYAVNASNGSQIWNFTPSDRIDSSPAIYNGLVYVGSRDGNLYALNASTGGQKWLFKSFGSIPYSPAVANDIVYVASNDNKTYAINATTGTHIWNYTIDTLTSNVSDFGSAYSSPAVVNNIVYIGSRNNSFYALNASTGSLIWSFVANAAIKSSPALTGTLVIFGTSGIGDSRLYILNASTGAHIWNYSITDSIDSSPAISGKTIYIGANTNTLYAFNLSSNSPATLAITAPSTASVSDSSFTINWSSNDTDNTTALLISCYGDERSSGNQKILTCFENSTNNGSRACDTTTWPAGQTFYPWCSSYDGIETTNAYAAGSVAIQHNTSWVQYQSDSMHTAVSSSVINNATLRKLWSYSFNVPGEFIGYPVVKNGIVVATSNYNKTFALNTSTGAVIWNKTLKGSDYVPSAIIGNGVVYISSSGSAKILHALNLTDGNEIWNYTQQESILDWPDTLDGTTLYMNTATKIYAFNTTTNTNTTLWTISPPVDFNGAPAIYNGMLFVGSYNANQTYAYNLTTRALIWNSTTGRPVIESGLSASNGIIYFATYDGNPNANKTLALNATNGNILWNFSIGSRPGGTPVIYNNTVFFQGSDNTNFYAVNATTGAQKWNITGFAAEVAFAIADNKIFSGINGRFSIIDVNGSVIRNGSAIADGVSLQSTTAIAENKIFFTGPDVNNSAVLFAFAQNTAPSLSVTAPSSNSIVDSSFIINWTSSDLDNDNLLISCYGDERSSGNNKILTCFENVTNNGSKICDTSSWPAGQTFYPWCSSNDQQNVSNSIATSYSTGNILVQHNSSWTQYQSDSMHTGVSTTTINNDTLVQLWNYTIGGSLLNGPVVKNGIVVVATDFNRTMAFNTTTGSLMWNRTIKNQTWVPHLIIGDNIVYQSGSNASGIVFAFNLTNGNNIWNYTQGATAPNPMTLDNGKLYLTRNGAIEIVNATTGISIRNISVPGGSFVGGAVIYNGLAIVGNDLNQTYAFNATTGILAWNSTTGGADFTKSLAVSNGTVYMSTSSQKNLTFALNATNGNKIWNFSTPGASASTPAIYNNTVFIGSNIGFFALNASSGAQYWNKSISDSTYGFAITSSDSRIIAPFDGKFYILSTNGDVIRNDSGPGPQGNLAVAENKVFLVKLGYPPYDNSTLMIYGTNSVPSIQTLVPGTAQIVDSSFTINWSASDANNHNLTIGCYGDYANSGSHKTLTCFENIANNGSSTCDTSNWPAGQMFYIWCSASDLYNTTNAYAPGNITVQHNSSWPMFRGDLARTGYSTSLISNATKLIKLWNYSTGSILYNSPIVMNGIVYIGDNKTYALNASTGTLIWNYTFSSIANQPVGAASTFSGGVIYKGFRDNKTYALNASTGAYIWNVSLGSEIVASSAVVNGIVYVGTDNPPNTNSFFALNATNGSQIWAFNASGVVESSPTIYNGIVYFQSSDIPSANYKVRALNASTGLEIWNFSLGKNGHSSPAISNGILYIGSGDNKTYALNATTGQHIWNFTTNGTVSSSPAIHNNIVYIGSLDGKEYALNASTGTHIWNYTTAGQAYSSSAIVNDIVIFGSGDNRTYILNASTGTYIWNYTFSAPVYSSPAIANGVLYITAYDGMVYAFTADETAPSVTASSPSGTISTSSTTLNVTTNENATCRYSTTASTAYASMTDSFTDSGTAHTKSLSSLSNGAKTYYVRCTDLYGNINETDYSLSFTVSVSSSSSSSSSGGGGGGGATTTTTTTPVSTTCTAGSKRCSGEIVQECASNTWVDVTTCTTGCETGSCKSASQTTTESTNEKTSTQSTQSTQTSTPDQTTSVEGTSPFGNFVKPDQKNYDQLFEETINNKYNKEALDSTKPIPIETKKIELVKDVKESIIIIDPLLPVKEVNFIPQKDAELRIELKRETQPERIVQRPYQYMKLDILQIIDGKEISLDHTNIEKDLGLTKQDLVDVTKQLDITENQLVLLTKDLDVTPTALNTKTQEIFSLTPKETIDLTKDLVITPKDLKNLVEQLKVPAKDIETKAKEIYNIEPKELVLLTKDLEVSPKDIDTKTQELFALTPKQAIELVTELKIAPKDLKDISTQLDTPATSIETKIKESYDITPSELVYLVKDLGTTVKDLQTKTQSLGLTIKETTSITKLGVPPSKIESVSSALGISPKALLTSSVEDINKTLESLNITKTKYGISVGDSQAIEGINLMSDLSNITIKFNVEKDWLYKKCIKKGWINLARYDEGLKYWKRLPTRIIGENITHVLYESDTPSLSLYAIEAKPLSCMCPPDEQWSVCKNDQSNRISYECSAATGSTCIPKVEKKSCSTGQILNEKKLDEYKPASPAEQEEVKSNNTLLIIAAVVGIVAIGGVVGFFGLRSRKEV